MKYTTAISATLACSQAVKLNSKAASLDILGDMLDGLESLGSDFVEGMEILGSEFEDFGNYMVDGLVTFGNGVADYASLYGDAAVVLGEEFVKAGEYIADEESW